MLFDVQAALSDILASAPATIATPATKTDQVAKVADVAAGPCEVSAAATPGADAFPHGFAAGGFPRTWTGRVVSLAEYRTLDEWEKHGLAGKWWCGKCKQERNRSTALRCLAGGHCERTFERKHCLLCYKSAANLGVKS